MKARLSPEQIHHWRLIRHKGRTDLHFLATKILGYDKIDEVVHGPVINHLQKFPVIPEKELEYYDRYTQKGWEYTPYIRDLYQLPSITRKMLLLDPRGWFKTTIQMISHGIQWLLNYPDMALYLVQSTNEKAELFLLEMKSHFIHNARFREIYPDYCPQRKLNDFGNRTMFILPNRRDFKRREPSVYAGSIEQSAAGKHFDVIKYSDIVDEKNSVTVGQLQSIVHAFGMSRNLLVRPDGFIDVEGTRYNFADLYGRIIDSHLETEPDKREWRIFVRGVYRRKDQVNFEPEELKNEYLRDEKGQFISWWPELYPTEILERMRKDPNVEEELFASQQLNNPIDTENNVFEYKQLQKIFIEPEHFKKVPIVYYTTTVDTAETDGVRSNYSAITTCGWGRDGKCYIADIRHGKFLPDRLVDELFTVIFKFKPISIKIEESSFVRGLKPTIYRRLEQIQRTSTVSFWPNFEWIKRDTSITKVERIQSIQPWYRSGDLRILSSITCRDQLIQEFTRFPKYPYDDILDSIADQFQNKDYFGRLSSRMTTSEALSQAQKEMLNLHEVLIFGAPDHDISPYHSETGGL